jgi:chemotaxis protein MotB
MDTPRPIIIVKKKGGHGGHHGGAWKVAYADFVTAMMALFIVLWLLNTNKPVREAVAGYFNDPSGTGEKLGTMLSGTGEPVAVSKENMGALKAELLKSLQQMPDFDKMKNQIEMTITPEGLRIELLETASGTFFDSGRSKPNGQGKEMLDLLAQQLGKLPNKISVEGHTDSTAYNRNSDYGNWELSADRANSARRLMQKMGLGAQQVTQIRGYADQRLRKPEAPLDPSNRRISVIVQYMEKSGTEKEKPAESAGEKPSAGSPPTAETPKKE